MELVFHAKVEIIFPEYWARFAMSRPPACSKDEQSETRPPPVRKATRGARSFPIAVNGIETAAAVSDSTAIAMARA